MTKKENQKAFLKAMGKTYGNITQSCIIANIDRTLPYRWEKEDEEFKEKFRGQEWGDMFLDMIENKLAKLAEEENPTILIFLAKTKGKKRGYIERQEVHHDTNTIKFQNVSKQFKDD